MLNTLLAALLLGHQTATPTITYETRATSLQKVLAEVGRQTGQTLTASEDIRENRVVVCLNKATPKETLDHFAQALGAEWVRSANGRELRRTPASLARLEREELADREPWLRKGFAKLTAVPKNAASFHPTSETHANDSLDIRAIELAGVEQLLALKPYSRTVFSTQPTRLQRPFGPGSKTLYSQYYKDWVAGRAAERLQHPNGDGASTTPKPDPQGGCVLLEVNVEPTYLKLRVYAYNTEGGLVHFSYDRKIEAPPNNPLAGTDVDMSAPFQQSEAGRALDHVYSLTCAIDERLWGIAVDMATKPEEHDLLEGDPSDAVLQVARAAHANAVVALSDEASFLAGEKEPYTLGDAVTDLSYTTRLRFGARSRWLTGSPRWDRNFETPNYPRTKLASIVSNAVERGGMPIDDCLEHALLTYRDEWPRGLAWTLDRFTRGSMSHWSYQQTSSSVLALIATLSPAERERARTGVKLRLEDLAPQQRSIVEHRALRQSQMKLRGDGLMRYDCEPTVVFADGFPKGSAITLWFTPTEGLAVRTRTPDGATQFQWMTLAAAAKMALLEERANSRNTLDYQPASHYTARVQYDFGPLGSCLEKATCLDLLRNGTWLSAEHLPGPVRQEFERELAGLRASRGKQ